MIYLISLFIATSIVAESLGVWLRFIGAVNSEPSLGYSSHVRFATLGRFFILLSAPLLGFLIDTGVSSGDVAMIGIMVFILVFVFLYLSFNSNVIRFLIKSYRWLNKQSNLKSVVYFDTSSVLINALNKKLMAASCVSFLLTASGILIVNYLATVFVDNRAMIVQMSAFVTMLGTLTHAFYVDPTLARSCDENADLALTAVISFIVGRVLSSLMLILLFFTLSLI